MLLEPGTTGTSDPALLAKVSRASTALPVGVDATYIVIGRRLFPITTPPSKEEPQ
jgi:hypothetical protein